MKSLKKYGVIFLAAAVWLLVLSQLTHIVLMISRNPVDISTIDLTAGTDRVFASVDEIFVSNNIMREVTISGWSFIENVTDSPEKEVKLIFASDDIAYSITMDLFNKWKIKTTLKSLQVPLDRTGFRGAFSPIGFKNGIYRLYIYNQETAEKIGIYDTGRDFKKDGKDFKEVNIGTPLGFKIGNQEISESIKGSLESCNLTGQILDVRGWAFIEPPTWETVEMQALVEIQRPDQTFTYYSTQRVARPEVARTFDNDQVTWSGFRAEIPLEAFGDGENIIRVAFDGFGRSTTNCVLDLP